MRKLFILLLSTLLCVSVLAGCSNTPKNAESLAESLEDDFDPDKFESEDIKEPINFPEAIEDAEGYFTEEFEEITYALEFDAEVNEDTKHISLFAVVSDDTTPEAALEFANKLVHDFNDLILYVQDEELALSSESSHGGIYSEYSVSVGVASKSQKDNDSQWFVKEEIPAGEYKALELQAGQ